MTTAEQMHRLRRTVARIAGTVTIGEGYIAVRGELGGATWPTDPESALGRYLATRTPEGRRMLGKRLSYNPNGAK